MELKKGDYVLATRWSDGDPLDPWAVGFIDYKVKDRYQLVDDNGKKIGGFAGFRRAQKIPPDLGAYILDNAEAIEQFGVSIWNMDIIKPMYQINVVTTFIGEPPKTFTAYSKFETAEEAEEFAQIWGAQYYSIEEVGRANRGLK